MRGSMTCSILLLIAFGLHGCGDAEDTGDTQASTEQDRDGDGYPVQQDCDDLDPDVHPDAQDICNGQDADCDGDVDEDPDLLWKTVTVSATISSTR